VHRRYFIQALAGSSASLVLLESDEARGTGAEENGNVSWIVKGFTCVTCAVGLQTILERHKGITRAAAEYPSGKVEVGFDSRVIAVSEIKHLIEQAGFKVTKEMRGSKVAVNQ
jgi:copper chaperone CopZ